jgi:1-acyl-sn-glycerol-3-phosphate acyltransferase
VTVADRSDFESAVPRSPGRGTPSILRRIFLFLRIIAAGTAFLGAWLGAIVLGGILFPLSRLRHRRAPAMDRAAACQRWLQRAFVLLFDYIRMWGLLHFNPRGVDASIPGQRYVMVANHPTLVDIAALSAVFGRIVCVAKPLLFRTPFLGQVLGACVYLEGGEMEGLAVAAVISQALDRLAQSMPLLVFPEGTRSPAGGLRRFRRGAFEIACRANVPVVPILIRCEPGALAKGTPWYGIPPRTAFFTVTRLPVMSPAAFGGDASSLTAACEATFRRHLGLLNPETPTNHE